MSKRGMEAKCFTVFPWSSAIIYFVYIYTHNSKVFHCFSIMQMQFTFLKDLPLKAFDIWMSLLRWGLHGHLARSVSWTWPGFWCFLHEGSLLLGEYPSLKPVGQIHVIFIFRIFSGVHGFLIPWIAFWSLPVVLFYLFVEHSLTVRQLFTLWIMNTVQV